MVLTVAEQSQTEQKNNTERTNAVVTKHPKNSIETAINKTVNVQLLVPAPEYLHAKTVQSHL